MPSMPSQNNPTEPMIPSTIQNASQTGDDSQPQPELRVYSRRKNPQNIENLVNPLLYQESKPEASM